MSTYTYIKTVPSSNIRGGVLKILLIRGSNLRFRGTLKRRLSSCSLLLLLRAEIIPHPENQTKARAERESKA